MDLQMALGAWARPLIEMAQSCGLVLLALCAVSILMRGVYYGASAIIWLRKRENQ